ncbi:reverse transcriptase domain-containing protein [Trichonephila clavipes]|nr:reverse transcriptase domain-containing protein [Trichonephila clavipes]
MLEKVIENWTFRLDYIRASRDSPMPEIIFKIIKDRALPWISDFLWDRSIRVNYNNCLSDPFAIRQGVPRGLVLSPVLFSLYITGIEKVLAKHCEVGIFADDIIVWSSGSDVGENELKLNRAMEEAYSFVEMHKLIFNASKSLTTFF